MFEFCLEATQGFARAGTLTLPHGPVKTPAFMPVGTHAVVRGLSAGDVRRTGAQIILGLRLISIHNIRFLVRLGEQARAHILDGTFDRWSREWLARYHAGRNT